MKIKKIKIITSITIILIMLSIQVSYAIVDSNNSSFLSVNTDKIGQKETLKIALDLNKIEYDKFKIVLNSNIDNDKIHTDDNITINEESDGVTIEIDKTKLNLGTIEMSYVVPEETEINSKIQLSVKVIVEEEVEQQDDEENTILVKQEKVVLEESKNIIVIDNKDNTNTETEKQEQNTDTSKEQNNNKEKNQKDSNKEQGENNKDNTNKTSNSQNNKTMASSNKSTNNKQNSINVNSISKNTNSGGAQSNKNVESAIYNGSNNNYLKNLSVKNIELNTNFNKENTTYFINVTNTSNLKITAIAEDNTAKVVIIGNDSIKEGTNKILISVTAENGNTRYYRIFAKCELSK